MNEYDPRHPSPPGDTILEWLDERDMPVEHLAHEMRLNVGLIAEVCAGAWPSDKAVQWVLVGALSEATGIAPNFWYARGERYLAPRLLRRSQVGAPAR